MSLLLQQNLSKLGQKIILTKREKAINNTDIALQIGVSSSMMTMIESGQQVPMATLIKVLDLLELSSELDTLFSPK
ncbi:MAG: hypothetical protein WCK52_02285 [Betaproteobacteria bacterium]